MPLASALTYDYDHMTKNTPVPPAASLLPIAQVLPSVRRLEPGDALFRQGDASFGLFRLVTGRIALSRVTPGGDEVPMHVVRAGELFAEASLFSERYHCDAVAYESCEVWVYPKGKLIRALRQDGDALWKFTEELAQRVQGLRARIEVGRIRNAPERVLQALRLRCNVNGIWKPDSTLKRFAEEIGLTHEALYRALAVLQRDGCITRKDGEIQLRAAGRGGRR